MNSPESEQFNIHLIGYAHIDPVWLWDWQESLGEIRATFRSALERMEETPDFKFTMSSAAFYQWIEEIDPELFEKIKQRVKEGRWEIAGGWWIEADCNIPCGESLVRQGLYGQRYFKKKFGKYVQTAFNPDNFGQPRTLPQILKKSGFQNYIFFHPKPGAEMEYPGNIFWWQSPDGSKILACRPPYSYREGSFLGIEEKIKNIQKDRWCLPSQKDILCFFGVGNHGGGPTKAQIAAINHLQKNFNLPNIIFSSAENFFSRIRKTIMNALPSLKVELQHYAIGCYSVNSEVKKLNRQSEHLLMAAERFSALASLVFGTKYPKKDIDAAWENILFNQAHDIIGGTCIPKTYEDTRDSYGEARQKASIVLNKAIQTIAKNVNTAGKGQQIIVFNPLPWPRKQIVAVNKYKLEEKNSIDVWDGAELPRLFITDDLGQEIPFQEVKSSHLGKSEIQFFAEVPGLGYRCYRIKNNEEGSQSTKIKNELRVDKFTLENKFWQIEVDPSEGYISRLYDKRNGIEVLKKGNIPIVFRDKSDTWSHGIEKYYDEVGRFREAEIQMEELGEVKATLRIKARHNKSSIEQFLTIYRDEPDIDCSLRVNWQEQYHLLKLAFETNIANSRAFYDIPYGSEEREADGREVPGQRWVCLEGETFNSQGKKIQSGLALINDSKYGFDAHKERVRITVLRSPAYAHSIPAGVNEWSFYDFVDQGWHTFKYSIIPYVGSWQASSIMRKAWEFNEPLIAHREHGHPGKLGPRASFLEVKPMNVILTVLKRAEDSKDLVIRAYESSGRDCLAEINFPYFNQGFRFTLKAYEIKTLKIKINQEKWEIEEVNMLEI